MRCVRTCTECTEVGKNFKPNKFQTQFGKLPSVKNVIDEIYIDFAEPFKLAMRTKNYLIVSIDNKSGWPEA